MQGYIVSIITLFFLMSSCGNIKQENKDIVIEQLIDSLNTYRELGNGKRMLSMIDSLKKMSLPYIKVRRHGKIMNIKTEELVVGDVVLIEAGDFVPADMRIIVCNGIRVEEASLTGLIALFSNRL